MNCITSNSRCFSNLLIEDEEALTLSKALHKKCFLLTFSVQPLGSLCLCGEFLLRFIHHRGTENPEVAQRRTILRVNGELGRSVLVLDFVLSSPFKTLHSPVSDLYEDTR